MVYYYVLTSNFLQWVPKLPIVYAAMFVIIKDIEI